MSDLATRTAAPLVTAASRKLGIDLPADLATALAEADRVRSGRHLHHETPDVAAAVADAILANKDPLSSKDVHRAALAATLLDLNIDNRLDGHATKLAAAALREHADAVIDTWRPVVERINAALQRFREHVPAGDPRADGLPTGLPAKALTPWGEAREALDKLDTIAQGWIALANVGAPYAGGMNVTRPLIVADLNLEQLDSLGTNPKCPDVTRLDVPLELASTAAYAERVARIQREKTQRQAYEAAAPERAREQRREQVRASSRFAALIP
ncbi:hypothetical protein [Nocardioides xinjiangensis]|uniref:hypothetical protein n=1 Tax=Nocardioides xinjiangensis TaxID=2817376 RepID=UPI001B30DB80|nr:hypothetical protein [Nocardioides sp. SYSU D00514]